LVIKTFKEFRGTDTEDLNESRLLRNGSALLLARSAKKHGDEAVRYLNAAQQKFRIRPSDTPEERIKRLAEGLTDLCEGLICIRQQNGAITGIVTTGILLSERINAQVSRIVTNLP
jgi:hypothetical protein